MVLLKLSLQGFFRCCSMVFEVVLMVLKGFCMAYMFFMILKGVFFGVFLVCY